MAKATGKTQNNINVILSHLRDKGLIRSTEVKDAIVYEKI
jgi:transcription initiation factor IIE alpha subunit